jgi:hypothetical protein
LAVNGPIGALLVAVPMHLAPLAGLASFPAGSPEVPVSAAEKYTTKVPDVVLIMSGAQIAFDLSTQLGSEFMSKVLVRADHGPAAIVDVDSSKPVPVENA